MGESARSDIGVVATTSEADAWDRTTLEPLRGCAIAQVTYIDLVVEGSPLHEWSGEADGMDYGIDFALDDGRHLSCTYAASEAIALDVRAQDIPATLGRNPEDPDAAYVASFPATKRFADKGFSRLDAVRSVWKHWQQGFGPFEKEGWALTSLVLGEGEASAVITLGDVRNGAFVDDPSNIAVVFSLAEARRQGIVLPGDPGTHSPEPQARA